MITSKISIVVTVFVVILCGCIEDSLQLDQKRMIVADIPGVGKVKGRRIETAWSGKNIFQFFDIKYGESPSGERRFKAPVPAKPWSEVRNAFTPRKGCPALQTLDYVRKNEVKKDVEDCLFLTISTKNMTQSRPVMVYLHGEFLYEGTTMEASPEYLLEKNVILVAVRYRLAPFGFLSTKTEALPGNAALMDVILALEWIQKYIKYFGGDPASVTLFGQVGGAAIANALTMSPKASPNLFHRVIYQSGSALTPAFTTEHPTRYSKDIGRIAGCPYEDLDKLNRCFIRMNATTLLEAFGIHGNLNSAKGIGSYGGLQFTVGGPSGVLPEHPGKLVQQKKIRYLPTMGGVVKNAGTFLLKEIFEDNFNGTIPDDKYDAKKYIEHIIKQTNGDDPTGAWKNFAEADFFTSKQLKEGTFKSMIPGLIDMCGTIAFKNPVLLALKANAAKLPNSTYLYSFNYEGEYNRYENEEDELDSDLPFHLGVSLTDENMYLFPWPQHVAYLNNYDTRIAKRMISLWTSFAAKGVPRATKIKNWPPMTGETGPYLRIDNSSTIEANFVKEYSITGQDARNGDGLIDEEYFQSLTQVEEEDDELGDDDDKL